MHRWRYAYCQRQRGDPMFKLTVKLKRKGTVVKFSFTLRLPFFG
ncbi:hypothetical protein OKW38_002255 [Paraburkholderia sp. MM5496-R1]